MPEGRYIVRLPFKNEKIHLDRQMALYCCFKLSLFRTMLIRDPINASEYREFLVEYETLDHMTKSPPTEIVKSKQTLYSASYLSEILREVAQQCNPLTSGLQCRTSNETSLNNHMLIGPKLQRHLAI